MLLLNWLKIRGIASKKDQRKTRKCCHHRRTLNAQSSSIQKGSLENYHLHQISSVNMMRPLLSPAQFLNSETQVEDWYNAAKGEYQRIRDFRKFQRNSNRSCMYPEVPKLDNKTPITSDEKIQKEYDNYQEGESKSEGL